MSNTQHSQEKSTKSREIRLFLFLIIVLFPLITIAIIGSYGLIVWISHVFTGPPGPPI